MTNNKINKKTRRDLLLKISTTFVYETMRTLAEEKLNRCDICEYTPPENQICKEDCIKYGFEELESINSAAQKITEIIAGRT